MSYHKDEMTVGMLYRIVSDVLFYGTNTLTRTMCIVDYVNANAPRILA